MLFRLHFFHQPAKTASENGVPTKCIRRQSPSAPLMLKTIFFSPGSWRSSVVTSTTTPSNPPSLYAFLSCGARADQGLLDGVADVEVDLVLLSASLSSRVQLFVAAVFDDPMRGAP